MIGPCGARGRCRLSPPHLLAECCKRPLNQHSFVSDVCLVVYFLWFVLRLCVCFCDLYSVFFLIVGLSVTVKWLAVKTAPEMTYTVSGGALNSAQSNPICSSVLQLYCLSYAIQSAFLAASMLLALNTVWQDTRFQLTALLHYTDIFISLIHQNKSYKTTHTQVTSEKMLSDVSQIEFLLHAQRPAWSRQFVVIIFKHCSCSTGCSKGHLIWIPVTPSHPSYSQYLTPNDFKLFRHLKKSEEVVQW